MSSTSIHIPNMLEAINSGIIPGSFNFNRTKFTFPTIKSTNSHGKTLLWTISISLKDILKNTSIKISDDMLSSPVKQLDNLIAVISVDSRQEGNAPRQGTDTLVTKGKSIKTKSATNVLTQAIRDALGKYNSKLKVASELIEGKIDTLLPPQLIKKHGDTKQATITEMDVKNGVQVQEKLDGIRMVAFNSDQIQLYSRKLNTIPAKDHIKDELIKLFQIANSLGYSGIYFDGEIFKHGLKLQDISGQSRRSDKELDEILEYHIFDCFFPNNERASMQSIDRQVILDKIFNKFTGKHLVRVPVIIPKSLDEIFILRDSIISKGGEGIVVRRNSGIYTYSYNSKRTSDVIKFKAKFDDEFEVIGFTSGKGKYKDVVIWTCKTIDNKTFNCDQKDMTIDDRIKLFHLISSPCKKDSSKTNFEYYLKGQLLTVEYEDLSKDGVPQRAKAVTFRTYEGPPGSDIYAQLIKML